MSKKEARKSEVLRSGEIKLNKSLKEAFINFLEGHPPDRLSGNLTRLLLEFMAYEKDIESPYLQDLAFDLQGLFDLLDAAKKEIKMKESQ